MKYKCFRDYFSHFQKNYLSADNKNNLACARGVVCRNNEAEIGERVELEFKYDSLF